MDDPSHMPLRMRSTVRSRSLENRNTEDCFILILEFNVRLKAWSPTISSTSLAGTNAGPTHLQPTSTRISENNSQIRMKRHVGSASHSQASTTKITTCSVFRFAVAFILLISFVASTNGECPFPPQIRGFRTLHAEWLVDGSTCVQFPHSSRLNKNMWPLASPNPGPLCGKRVTYAFAKIARVNCGMPRTLFYLCTIFRMHPRDGTKKPM